MRVLITGAGGQLGRALSHALQSEEVLALDHRALDVTEARVVTRRIAGATPEVVIHCAALTDTAACERDPQRAMRGNADGARNVALACRDAGAAMVYISTNEVFDGEKGSPYGEDDATNPINSYGRSKLAGEQAVRESLPAHFVVRTSWVYGPGRASFPEKIVGAARSQGRLRLVTDEVASPTWTPDLADAIVRLVRSGRYGVFHLTNDGSCSRLEWATEVLKLAGIEVPVEAVTQDAFGSLFRKPVDSSLANVRAAGLGIELRPWPEALADHMRHPEVSAALGLPLGARQ